MTTDNLEQAIEQAGWSIGRDVLRACTPFELDFVERELTQPRSLELYVQRIRNAGLAGCESVLDAACGIGQWSRAFTLTGSRVIGIDLSAHRLDFARELNSDLAPEAFRAIQSSISTIPLADCSVDLVFCYGSLMFADVKASLLEFNRVLKPGGIVYVNASSWGWYLKRSLTVRGQRCASSIMIANTLLGKNQGIVLSPRRLRRELLTNGFSVVASAPEGEASLLNTNPAQSQPFYPARVWGLPGVTEVIACKPL